MVDIARSLFRSSATSPVDLKLRKLFQMALNLPRAALRHPQAYLELPRSIWSLSRLLWTSDWKHRGFQYTLKLLHAALKLTQEALKLVLMQWSFIMGSGASYQD
jgi:hypothetical protein